MENLNFVLGQLLVHNEMLRSNRMCAFNVRSVVKTSLNIYYHRPYKTGVEVGCYLMTKECALSTGKLPPGACQGTVLIE